MTLFNKNHVDQAATVIADELRAWLSETRFDSFGPAWGHGQGLSDALKKNCAVHETLNNGDTRVAIQSALAMLQVEATQKLTELLKDEDDYCEEEVAA